MSDIALNNTVRQVIKKEVDYLKNIKLELTNPLTSERAEVGIEQFFKDIASLQNTPDYGKQIISIIIQDEHRKNSDRNFSKYIKKCIGLIHDKDYKQLEDIIAKFVDYLQNEEIRIYNRKRRR